MSFNQNSGTAVPTLINSSATILTANAVSSNALTVRQFGTGNVFSAQTTTGSTALFVNANGNVGVGTTNPATALDVFTGTMNAATLSATTMYGALAGSNTVSGTTITASSSFSGPGTNLTGSAASLSVGGSAGSLSTTYTAGRILYGANSGVPTTVSTLFYDSANGRVGIGSASPASTLDLSGGQLTSRYIISPSGNYLTIQNGAGGSQIGLQGTTTAITGGTVYMTGGNVGIGTTNPAAPLNTYFANSGIPNTTGSGTSNVATRFQVGSVCLDMGNISNGNMWLQNHLDTNWATNYPLLLNPNGGNVGVGTASPGYTLDVGSYGVDGGTIRIASSSSCAFRMMEVNDSYGFSFTNVASSRLSIKRHSASSAGSEIISIMRDNPYVGIGTASPSYPLHVASGVGTTNTVKYFNGTTTTIASYSGGITASIYSQNDILTAGSFAGISDRRAKIPEEPPTESYLNLVEQIQVHQYSWIDKVEKGSSKKIGFFAQEVEAVVPDAVGRTTAVVPTIYRQAEGFTDTTVTIKNHGITIEKKLEVVDLKNGKTKIDILRVIDLDNLEVKFEKAPKDKLFVVGPEVDDSRMVNHDYLMAVGFGGLKELSALVKTQQTTIEMLTERLALLESKLTA